MHDRVNETLNVGPRLPRRTCGVSPPVLKVVDYVVVPCPKDEDEDEAEPERACTAAMLATFSEINDDTLAALYCDNGTVTESVTPSEVLKLTTIACSNCPLLSIDVGRWPVTCHVDAT